MRLTKHSMEPPPNHPLNHTNSVLNKCNRHMPLCHKPHPCKLRLLSLPLANNHKEPMCYRNYKLVVEGAFPEVVEEGISNKVSVVVPFKVSVVVNDYPANILRNSFRPKVNVLRLIVLYPLVLQQVDQVNNDVNLLFNNSKVNCLDLLDLVVSMLVLPLFNLV